MKLLILIIPIPTVIRDTKYSTRHEKLPPTIKVKGSFTNNDTSDTEFLFRLFIPSALCDTSTISINRMHRTAESKNGALHFTLRATISIGLRLAY